MSPGSKSRPGPPSRASRPIQSSDGFWKLTVQTAITAPDISTCENVAMQLEAILSLSAPPPVPGFRPNPKRRPPTSEALRRGLRSPREARHVAAIDGRLGHAFKMRARSRGATCHPWAVLSHQTTIAVPWRRSQRQRGGKLAASRKPLRQNSPLTVFVATVLSRDADYVSRRLRARK